jgi:MinD-like ATPase involved in chromosome partitioning or flagellar assembly
VTAGVRVVTCAGGAPWEAPLVQGLARRELGVDVLRRCVDHGELLGVSLRDRPRAAIVAAELPWLDRDLVGTLGDSGVTVVAVGSSATRPLESIGVAHRLDPSASADEVAAVLHRLEGGAAAALDAPHARATPTETAGGRLIAVWGAPGAPGRTTVAVHLAIEAARLGIETVLIDGDAWSATVAQRLGLEESPAVPQAARLAADGWPSPLEDCLQQGPAGCAVLAGLPRAELWPEVRPRSWTAVLDAAVMLATLVIVDLAAPIEEDEELAFDRVPYRRNLMTLTALDAAHETIVVGGADPIGLRRVILAHRTLVEAKPAVAARASVVLNRTPSSARRLQDASKAISDWTGSASVALLPSEPAFERAVWDGCPLGAIAPRSPWLREIRSLAGVLVR